MDNSKVVIITGGGQGIGSEIGMHLHSQNMRVVIAEKDSSLQQNVPKHSSGFLFLQTDVASETSVKKLIHTTIKQFGRIDVLINNAGRLPNNLPSIEKLPLKTWNEFINTNLTGAFLCTKYAAPHLRKVQGNIINIASTRAYQSEGDDIPYSATKGGLVSLTQALAVSLGPEIRVNTVSPGWINSHDDKLSKKDHEQHPVGRVGKPEDIASMVAYLISDQASFITGQNFVVDGGMTIKMIYV